ncbi:MAG: polyprenol monophosphomannose synthase [Candidatus Uhrbacteria bacterium]
MRRNNFIVIPTYNERKTIIALVPRIVEALPEVRILVADDNSPDGTQEAVKELMLTYPQLELYPHNMKAGYAKACIDAILLLLAREPDLYSVTMMDADLSHDPSYLPEIMNRLETHNIVIGSRYVRGGGVSGWEWWRRMLSAGGNIYYRTVSGLPVHDITAGFNAIQADLLRKLGLGNAEATGYAFTFLLKYRAYMTNEAKFFEVPIIFKNREEGESKMHLRIILEALRMPWKYPRIKRTRRAP